MKNFRSLATSLLAATIVTLASAQQSDDITALRTKAEKGNGLAQYNLGLAYAEGRGVTADKIEAFVWLSLARENGARGRALDSLVATLDKTSLENAQRRLAEQKAITSGKIPVVSTGRNDPEAVATIKTDNAPAVGTPSSSEGYAQQIATLTADKKQLSEEVAKAWKEIDGLNTALAKAEKNARASATQSSSATELENAAKFSRELEATLNRTNEQKAAAEKNLAAVQAELAAQNQKIEKLAAADAARVTPSAEIASVRQQLGEAQAKITTLTSDLTSVRASETNLHDTVTQLEDEKAKLAAAKPAYPDLSSRVGELEAQLARATHNAEAASTAATAASKQSAADLTASAAEIVRLQGALVTAKSSAPTYPDLSGKVRDLEAQLARATETAEAATTEGKKHAADLAAATAEIERVQNALAAAKSSSPAYPDLSGKVHDLEARAADSAQKLTTTAQNSAKLATEVTQLQHERDELSGRVASLSSELTRLRADQEGTQKQLAAAKSAPAYPDLSGKVRDLETQLARANERAEAASSEGKKHATDLTATTAEVERLQNALAAAKSSSPAYPDLSGKVHDLEAGAADSAQKLAAAIAAQTALQHKLDEASAAAQNSAKSATEVTQLQRERDDLSGRVASLSSELTRSRTDQEGTQKLLADAKKQVTELAADAKRAQALEGQNTSLQTSLGSANARIAALQTAASRKPDAPAYPDLSGKVRELETKLAATNQQADAAVQTAVNASKQNTADLNGASAKIEQLEKELAAKNAASTSSANEQTVRLRELESQLSAANADSARTRQEIVSLTKARDEALKNHGPAYPNLAGRVVELQNALADAKRDLSDAQTALHTEQARAATPAPAVATTPEATAATSNPETDELQKKLADTENKLSTALRGYALLQRERDSDTENSTKASEALTNERNTLNSQVAALTSQVEQLKATSSNQTAVSQAETSRVNESLSALQRSTSQNSSELTAARALIAQLQGANTVLANENYQLKSKLTPGGVAPATLPTAPTSPAAAAAAVEKSKPTAVASTTPRIHVVAAGDTLFRISQRYYGNVNRWQEIYKANAAKLGANGVLRVGMELTIP